jgi:hypothetical protein
MKLNRESASLAPRRIGFESRHLHLCLRLRSVSGKHAPVVRPRCGFESCRRLLPTPVAQWTERCPATAAAAGSTPAGRTRTSSRGRSSDGRAPGFHPGEARSIRVVRSHEGPRCNPARMASPELAVPGANPGRPVHPSCCCGPERIRLSTTNRQDAGSNPARSIGAPVAQR